MTSGTSLLAAVPFLGLLLTIALAPLVVPRAWHRHYGKLVFLWAGVAILSDGALHSASWALATLTATVLHEYLPFVLLLGALFVITGGLRITGASQGTPAVNTALLAAGTVLASFVGTTGAALLVIRPMLRANRHRRPSAHVFVFLIVLVANVGGALTPLGNPPNFLGFLAGVPFFWPLTHLWAPTALVSGGLLGTFFALDTYLHRRRGRDSYPVFSEIEKHGIEGGISIALLAIVMVAITLRAVWHDTPRVAVFAVGWDASDIVSDVLFFLAGLLSLVLTPRHVRQRNDFAWEPMVEVTILFAGIFVTLAPVTALIAARAEGPAAPLFALLVRGGVPDDGLFYWGTGLLSAVLDNAPTYLIFFGLAGGDATRLTADLPRTLAAISGAAAFFGALTYVGNAPNLLIKGLAESQGVRMPHFFGYIGWATICLLPWLVVAQLLFFT
jgi:Na+/H+ antiporter NhaD/arsenite permease-like protein